MVIFVNEMNKTDYLRFYFFVPNEADRRALSQSLE